MELQMEVAGILVLAALAGYAVYRLSLRAAGEPAPPIRLWGRARAHHGGASAGGAEPAVGASAAAPHPFGSVSLRPLDAVPWRHRLLGLAELVVLVALSSGALAFAVYQLVHSLRLAFEKWAGG